MQRTVYTAKRLVIPQQLPDDFSEIYFIVNFSRPGDITEIIVNTQLLHNEIRRLLERYLSCEQLPYGYSNYDEMVCHLIHPHSIIADRKNNIYVFYKQIPHYRKVNLNTGNSELLPAGGDFDPDAVYASTSQMDAQENFYVSVNSFSRRLQKYTDNQKELDFKVGYFNTARQRLSIISEACPGLIDNIHQVGCSSSGDFLVLLDMNLGVDYPLDPAADLMSPAFKRTYSGAHFPKGKLYVYDLKTQLLSSIGAPLPTIAHVEFDQVDPSVFYVSCHNMSKIKSNMALHGPGAIIKYRYKRGEVEVLGLYSSDDFYRITTHKLFTRNGKQYLAVNGYPNYLFVIATDNMKLACKIKLFAYDEQVHFTQGIYLCTDNNIIPLYLDVSEDGRFILMPSAQYIYVVDFESGTMVEALRFTQRECISSAHVLLI